MLKKTFQTLKKHIRYVLLENMYKYWGRNLINVIKDKIFPLIDNEVNQQNLNATDISTMCNDKNKKNISRKMKAMLVSYYYLFYKPPVGYNLGAGDLSDLFVTQHITNHYFPSKDSLVGDEKHVLVGNLKWGSRSLGVDLKEVSLKVTV